MGTIVLPTSFVDGTVPTAAQFNGDFNAIVTEFNGSITNANISASAGIAATKISGTAANLTEAQTFSGAKTFTQTIQTWTTATDAATVTFNLALGNLHRVTLGGNRTLALSNSAVGQAFIVRLLQDGTGSRTVTWFSTINWAGGSAPTLTTTASKADVFGFVCTATNTFDGFIVGQNL